MIEKSTKDPLKVLISDATGEEDAHSAPQKAAACVKEQKMTEIINVLVILLTYPKGNADE